MAKKHGTQPKAKHQVVRAALLLPEGHEEFRGQLKERIRTAQLRAALAVNRVLIELYWHINRSVVVLRKIKGWGSAVLVRLGDLQKAFPSESGFSRTNASRMGGSSSPTKALGRSSQSLWDKPLRANSRRPSPNSLENTTWGHITKRTISTLSRRQAVSWSSRFLFVRLRYTLSDTLGSPGADADFPIQCDFRAKSPAVCRRGLGLRRPTPVNMQR